MKSSSLANETAGGYREASESCLPQGRETEALVPLLRSAFLPRPRTKHRPGSRDLLIYSQPSPHPTMESGLSTEAAPTLSLVQMCPSLLCQFMKRPCQSAVMRALRSLAS